MEHSALKGSIRLAGMIRPHNLQNELRRTRTSHSNLEISLSRFIVFDPAISMCHDDLLETCTHRFGLKKRSSNAHGGYDKYTPGVVIILIH